MLKVLRVSSFVVMILASCVIVATVILLLKDYSEAKTFLQSPGIIEQIRGNVDYAESKENAISPLVAQARAFALRINPPVKVLPQEEIITQLQEEKHLEKIDRQRVLIEQNQPKTLMFDLLATVRYVSAPEKSLALFQSGGRQEWFYMGQTVGRHKIEDIKDGRVLMTQPGRNQEEVFVPPKPDGTALLEGDKKTM